MKLIVQWKTDECRKMGCKSLRTTTPMMEKRLLGPKDGFIGDLRNIDISRVKAFERVGGFHIGCTHKNE